MYTHEVITNLYIFNPIKAILSLFFEINLLAPFVLIAQLGKNIFSLGEGYYEKNEKRRNFN